MNAFFSPHGPIHRLLQGVVALATIASASIAFAASTPSAERDPVPIPARSKYVGINLSGMAYWTSEFPFADLMKNSGGFSLHNDSGAPGADVPPTNGGYPMTLAPGQNALAAVAWTKVHYALGRYVVLWDGDGKVSFPNTRGTITMGDHRATIDVTDNADPMWVSIAKTNPADPVRNIRFLWPGTESTYAKQMFNPVFLSKIAPFSVLRFMDWAGTNGSPVVEWADRSHVSDLAYTTPKGVPIEVMIDLANTLHVDPWFCIPHRASDDYVKQFATLLHQRLDPTLKVRLEYSNEMWNSGFAQTTWGKARSTALGLATPWGVPSVFYAQRAVEVFKIARAVYGADSTRLVRVIAGQAGWTQFLENALAWKDTAANTDVIAIAPYFSAGAASKPANVDATLAAGSDAIVDQMLVSVRGDVKKWLAANQALAKKYGLKMEGYESGVGDTTFAFSDDKRIAVTALVQAANRSPRMQQVYNEYFDLWVAAGGGVMNQFNDVGNWSVWGSWGALEYVTQDAASAPKYRALLDFIAQHPTTK